MEKSKNKPPVDPSYSNTFDSKKYGHWKSSAEKTRFSAFVLWELSTDSNLIETMKAKCPNGTGDSSLTLSEAFRRESALALELVIKAVIARKITDGILGPEKLQLSHNIPELWKTAEICNLSKEDRIVLLRAKEILMWSGRYATPKTAEVWIQESQEFDNIKGKISYTEREFTFELAKYWDWPDFDRLYQMAYKVLVSPPST